MSSGSHRLAANGLLADGKRDCPALIPGKLSNLKVQVGADRGNKILLMYSLPITLTQASSAWACSTDLQIWLAALGSLRPKLHADHLPLKISPWC